MDTLLSDVRYAVRGLLRSPGVAAVAVGVLALGIGLTTIMFSIVYGAIHRGLPFEDGDRFTRLRSANPSQDIASMAVSVHDFVDWSARQRSFEGLAAYSERTVNVTIGDRPERFDGAVMTGNALPLLRVEPLLGRSLTEGDALPGAPATLLIGFRAWRDQFGADPAVVGRSVRVDGAPATVVGVMPEGFEFPETQHVWLPLRLDAAATPRGDGPRYDVFGKLREGVSVEAADAELARIAVALALEHPVANQGVTAWIEPFTEGAIGDEEKNALYAMLATVGLVLLIACANVANLLLARAAVRTKDVAVRIALGAGRMHVILRLMAEALVLALVGAALGSALAWVGIEMFARAVATTGPPFWLVFALDGPVLVFVIGITLLAGLVSGAIPALRASTSDVNSVLKDESRGSSGVSMGRLSRGLVVAEVAMSLALLVASGLMIRSVVTLDRMALPYPSEDVLTASVSLSSERFAAAAARERFWEQVEERLAALPGVRSAGVVTTLPGIGAGAGPVQIDGTAYRDDADVPSIRLVRVSPGFFATLGVAPLQGRVFTRLDDGDAPPVAVVNQSFVRERFPDGVALGRRIRVGPLDTGDPWREIVGVIPDVGIQRLGIEDQGSPAGLYVPVGQDAVQLGALVVRAQGDPLALTGAVRDAVVAIDPDTPIYAVYTLRGRLDDELWFYGVFGTLFAVFGAAALFMASVGLYGVMSFSVSRRTQEMGIRMALGAEGTQVRSLVVRQGMAQIALGMVIGTGLALLVARGLQLFLLGGGTWDPATYGLVFAVLALTGLLASALPAARATRIDPVDALRAG